MDVRRKMEEFRKEGGSSLDTLKTEMGKIEKLIALHEKEFETDLA